MRKLGELIDWHVAVATDPAVNGGWKLVPVEPTQEMIEQGSSTINDSGGSARWSEAREAWAAMLVAAPTPPVDENTSQERVRMPEPMTEEEVNDRVRSRAADNLLDHIYESGVTSEGVKFYMAAFVRAVEAEVLRRVKEANE